MKDTNSIGDSGVQKVSARLNVACFANVRQGSYSEDSLKSDILFTFKSAFDKDELCEIKGQVKTGDSFITIDPCQTTARIDNCSDVNKVIVKTGMLLIIFAVVDPKEIHWYSGDVRSRKLDTIKIPVTQTITPSVWIDFSRLYRYWQYQRDGYSTQTLSPKTLSKESTRNCKIAFNKIKSTVVSNPIMGNIDVTQKSWEHITRAGKTIKSRHRAIKSVKHLEYFLKRNPDRIGLKNIQREVNNGVVREKREIMMYFRKGISYNDVSYSFVIRINELIEYPEDWVELTLSTEQVIHRRKVASWWIKKNA